MKRVSICSELDQLSAYTVLMPYNAIPDELLGKIWSVHVLAPTPCLLQVLNHLLIICLNTPPQPTWGHSMHFYDQTPRPPPLIKSPNKGANRLGFS